LRAIREIVALAAGPRQAAGSLVYGVFQDRRGRWMVYLQGRGIREFAGEGAGKVEGPWTGPLPGPIRHDNVVQAFPKSDG